MTVPDEAEQISIIVARRGRCHGMWPCYKCVIGKELIRRKIGSCIPHQVMSIIKNMPSYGAGGICVSIWADSQETE
jgi:hypothetical protein